MGTLRPRSLEMRAWLTPSNTSLSQALGQTVGAYVGVQNFGDAGAPPPCDWGVANLVETRSYLTYVAMPITVDRSNIIGIRRGSHNILGTLGPRPRRMWLTLWLAVWCSGNALVSINAVALHRARLVLGWVTAFGQVNCLIT